MESAYPSDLTHCLTLRHFPEFIQPAIIGNKFNGSDRYRAKQVSMPQPGRCQGFGGAITQIVVFRAIKLKPLSPIQLAF